MYLFILNAQNIGIQDYILKISAIIKKIPNNQIIITKFSKVTLAMIFWEMCILLFCQIHP